MLFKDWQDIPGRREGSETTDKGDYKGLIPQPVPKKDGSFRSAVNLRPLNQIMAGSRWRVWE